MQRLMVTLPLIVALISGTATGREKERNDAGTRNRASRGYFQHSAYLLDPIEGTDFLKTTHDSLVFVDATGQEWIAPTNTYTDGATIPTLLLPFTGGKVKDDFLRAAIVHDAYCQRVNKLHCPEQYRKRPWQAVHQMFYDACRACGADDRLAGGMFAGVWVKGPRWDRNGKDIAFKVTDTIDIWFDGCVRWIRKTMPTREEVEAWLTVRERPLKEILELRQRGAVALSKGKFEEADTLQAQSNAILAETMKQYPEESMFACLKAEDSLSWALSYAKASIPSHAIPPHAAAASRTLAIASFYDAEVACEAAMTSAPIPASMATGMHKELQEIRVMLDGESGHGEKGQAVGAEMR